MAQEVESVVGKSDEETAMKIIENNRIFAFDSKNEPVAEVMDGEIVIFRTHDCFDNQLSEEGTCIGALNWDRIIPATGPVYVQNAMAGDVLKVEILEITLDQQGVMCALPDNGVLGSLVKEESVNKKKRNPILQKQLKRKRICGLAVS